MHPLWIHTFFKGYIFGPKMVEVWQDSTPYGIFWDFLHTNSPP